MPWNLEGKTWFIGGVRVEGFYDPKKTKAKIRSDFNPVFPLVAFVDTITKFRAQAQASKPEHSADSKEFVTFTMHEIRRLNLDIKSQAEEMIENLSRGSVDTNFLGYRAQNIFGTSSLVSIRLDAYDFHVNPAVFSTGTKISLQVYRKFEKAMHCLQVESRKKQTRIRFVGQSYDAIMGHSVLELLPFVLLENAIKYSPPNQEVTVTFQGAANRLEIIISSIGPTLFQSEEKDLFARDFRGVNAKKMCDGTGAGLHFARLVCDLHGIKIAARSNQTETLRLNGIPYSEFTVTLAF